MLGSGGGTTTPSASLALSQDDTSLATPTTPAPTSSVGAPEFMSPPFQDKERLDVVHSDMPVRYRTIGNLIREDALAPGLVLRELEEASLLLARPGKPCSSAEVESDEAWHATMKEEMNAVN
ncbi:hypothetical protein E2562_013613 [Oryza meyeriana var. granulata]|uniref:Uncharacterized protein n=1 Tax=Oryza meyeriana var. granulata TaxID=110450 RepID=A0A6G1C660_9ORYZ|nr:hypothetical protein E2562_013613 [Oryza meyeriana var. granulata]